MNSNLPKLSGLETSANQLRQHLRLEVEVVTDVPDAPPARRPAEGGVVGGRVDTAPSQARRRPGADRARGEVTVEVAGRLLGQRERDDRAHREAPEQRPVRLPDSVAEVRDERLRVGDAVLHRPAVRLVRRAGNARNPARAAQARARRSATPARCGRRSLLDGRQRRDSRARARRACRSSCPARRSCTGRR